MSSTNKQLKPNWFIVIPGFAFAALIAVMALYIGKLTLVFNDVILAIILGAVIRNLVGIQEFFKPGLSFSLKKVLRLAIILLGMQLSFQQVVNTGGRSLIIILFVVSAAIPLTYFIGRKLGLNRELSLLLGVGSSICGASAVLAMGPVINAKERDVGLAVATIFIFNTLALLLFPVIGKLLHLSYLTYGTWTGVAVQDVSSVVATGFALGQNAGVIATVVKLTRTVFIVPVIFLAGLFFSQNKMQEGDKTGERVNYVKIFPWFVVGFLLMALLNSAGIFPKSVVTAVNPVTHFLILIVMVGVGTDLDFTEIKKVGFAFLVAGLTGMLIMSILSFVLIKVMGIA